jgi:hypothetical protein
MPPIFWIAIAIGMVVIFLASKVFMPSLDKVVEQSAKKNDINPILKEISRMNSNAQPSGFNRAIRWLWDGYQRSLAAELVVELAKNHGDAKIAHYWIKQVLTVEPETAKDKFSKEFLKNHYQPEVAAQCGQAG